MKVTKEGIPIVEIKLFVKNVLKNVRLKVRADKPEDMEEIENSYKYVTIEKTNIEDEDIEKVELYFNVEKDWIEENNYEEDNIFLFKYENGAWKKLKTEKIESTESFVKYKAELTSLSVFAIAYVRPEVKPKEEIPKEKEIPEKKEEVPTPKEEEKVPEVAKPKKVIWPYIVVIVVIIIILVVFYLLRLGKVKKTKTKGKTRTTKT